MINSSIITLRISGRYMQYVTPVMGTRSDILLGMMEYKRVIPVELKRIFGPKSTFGRESMYLILQERVLVAITHYLMHHDEPFEITCKSRMLRLVKVIINDKEPEKKSDIFTGRDAKNKRARMAEQVNEILGLSNY